MSILKKFSSYNEIDNKYVIPEFQRNLMYDKIGEMKMHVIQRNAIGKEPIFGVINFVDYNNKLHLVDGQHRITALKLAYEETGVNVPFNAIIYQTTEKEEVKLIFNTGNKNTPMPDFYLEEDNTNTKLLQEIEKYVISKKGFRYDIKNRPEINIKNFLDTLNSSKILKSLKTCDDFYIMYNIVNDIFKRKVTDSTYLKANKLNGTKILEKCRDSDNYLGVDIDQQKSFSWMNNDSVINSVEAKINNTENVQIPNFWNQEETDSKRRKFTQVERQQIWHKYIGADKGKIKCPLCKINDIEPLVFVIAHVKSLHNGGTNDLSNLRPVCSCCNSSDGTKTLDLSKYSVY